MVRTIFFKPETEALTLFATGRWTVEALSSKVPFTKPGISRNEAMQDVVR